MEIVFILDTLLLDVGNNTHIINPKAIMQTMYKANDTPINLLQDTDMEYGSNEHGNYIKYSNGVLIQWGNILKTISIKNRYGSMYYDDDYGITLPLNFLDIRYTVTVTPSNKSGAVIVYSCSNYHIGKFNFNLMSPAQLNSLSEFYFDWFAIGRWK